jgi:hypothetical protein
LTESRSAKTKQFDIRTVAGEFTDKCHPHAIAALVVQIPGTGQVIPQTSDYYVVGYYSTNPDEQVRTRALDIRVNRADADVWSRTSYSLRPPRDDSPVAQ